MTFGGCYDYARGDPRAFITLIPSRLFLGGQINAVAWGCVDTTSDQGEVFSWTSWPWIPAVPPRWGHATTTEPPHLPVLSPGKLEESTEGKSPLHLP